MAGFRGIGTTGQYDTFVQRVGGTYRAGMGVHHLRNDRLHGRFPVRFNQRIIMDMEKKMNLFWTIVWGLLLITSIIAAFWNPGHIFTIVASAVFFGLFLHDYIKCRNL